MAVAGGFATIASTLIGAAGTVLQTQAAASAAEYQASVARMNKQIAEDNARRAIERSQIEQQDQDTQTAALLGEQLSKQGASGLSLSGRSQLLTRKSAAQLGRRDALNVRQAGELEAYGFKTDAVNYEARARLAEMEADSNRLGGFLAATGQLFKGYASLPDSLIGGSSGVKNSRRFGTGLLTA